MTNEMEGRLSQMRGWYPLSQEFQRSHGVKNKTSIEVDIPKIKNMMQSKPQIMPHIAAFTNTNNNITTHYIGGA